MPYSEVVAEEIALPVGPAVRNQVVQGTYFIFQNRSTGLPNDSADATHVDELRVERRVGQNAVT